MREKMMGTGSAARSALCPMPDARCPTPTEVSAAAATRATEGVSAAAAMRTAFEASAAAATDADGRADIGIAPLR